MRRVRNIRTCLFSIVLTKDLFNDYSTKTAVQLLFIKLKVASNKVAPNIDELIVSEAALVELNITAVTSIVKTVAEAATVPKVSDSTPEIVAFLLGLLLIYSKEQTMFF